MTRPEAESRPWRLMLATGNKHKVRELEAMLRAALPPGTALELLTPDNFPGVEEPEETGATFMENALIKAHAWARATGCLALADDSGLVVDSLEGRPGVRSARYADTPARRIERVLAELQGKTGEERRARFVCVMALADPGGRAICRDGRIEGEITREPRGSGGFGYDPIFRPRADDPMGDPANAARRTLSEYGEDEKNRVSHRGRALAGVLPHIIASLPSGCIPDLP